MRIALIVPGGVDRSGRHRVIPALLALIERLAARNEVHVIALNQEPEPGSWPLAGALIHNIGLRRMRPRAITTLRHLHRSAPFDVLHSIWSGACGLVTVAAGRLLHVPTAIHIAGGELVAFRDINYGGLLTWRGRLREAIVLRATGRITAASEPVVQSLRNLGLQGVRIPLGVDLTAWPPREPVARLPGATGRLIHLASLNRVKDQPMLLRALALLKQTGERFQMRIVGEDTLGGSVQRLAAELGLLDCVQFRGFLEQEQLRPLMETADLMVMSSRHEAGPLSMLEAAAVGVPTVGTAVGHIAEWAPEAAIAVPVEDAPALANALLQLLQDEGARLRVARAAHARAIAEDADYTARRFEALYDDLIRQRG